MLWVTAGVLLLAAVFGACFLCAGLLLRPPSMSPMSVFPEQFGLPHEKISFRTRDGLKLKGWFVPSAIGDRRTIVMCHGMSDNKGELLGQTYFLNKPGGFNLLYFDFRSHGESEGEITTTGGLETHDFDAAVEWLRTAKPHLSGNAGVFGLSMGAAVAVVSMPKHPGLRCAAVESPFTDYQTVIRRWFWNKGRVPYYPLVALIIMIVRARARAPEIDRFHPLQAAAGISPRPLFVIGGEGDRLMTAEDVKTLFDAALEPKQLWLVPEAAHARCRQTAGAEYDARLLDFFSKNL